MKEEPFRSKPPEWRLEYSLKKLRYHRNVCKSFPSNSRMRKVYKWANFAAHAVFDMHPELREEGSLARFFVAKVGRRQGLSGSDLTRFVEEQYANGTWWKLVPDGVLKGKPIAPPAGLSDGTHTHI